MSNLSFLLILDDVVGVIKRGHKIQQIVTQIRHYKCGIIISMQKLHELTPTFRAQVRNLIMFATKEEEAEKISKVFADIKKKTFMNVYEYAT